MNRAPAALVWVDGGLRAAGDAAVAADDGAYQSGRGCYTAVLWTGTQLQHGERSARRLARDAAQLALGPLDPETARAAMRALAEAVFGNRAGVVRLQASRDARGQLHLVGVPRELGEERPVWRACSAPFAHPGPTPWGGAKVTNHLHCAWAREHARAKGDDEALLWDAAGRLVEGARTNLFLVRADGSLVTPPLERGGVAGVAREVLVESLAELRIEDVERGDLDRARELIAANGVRGARPVVAVDGAAVGSGSAGPLAKRLADILDAAGSGTLRPTHGG